MTIFFPSWASKIEHSEKYLAYIIFAMRLSGVFHILQHYFAKRALLKHVKYFFLEAPYGSNSSKQSVYPSPCDPTKTFA